MYDNSVSKPESSNVNNSIPEETPSTGKYSIIAGIAVAIIFVVGLVLYISGDGIIHKIVALNNLITPKLAELYLNNQQFINTIFFCVVGVFGGSVAIGGGIYAGYELSELRGKKPTRSTASESDTDTSDDETDTSSREGSSVNEVLYPTNSTPGKSRVDPSIYDDIPE